uniref:Uncharacterized protein n=1 Tax=Leersia perrieri TaxID=77586 RepID=A0A0D9WAT4_9ORYZ
MSERAIELGCYPTAGTYVVNDRVRRDFRLDIEGLHEELYHDSDIDEFYHREWRVPGEFDEDQDRIFDVEQGRVTESTGDTGLLRHRLGRQISSSSSSSSGGDSGQTLINKLVYDIHTMLIKDTQRAKRILNEERLGKFVVDSVYDFVESGSVIWKEVKVHENWVLKRSLVLGLPSRVALLTRC